MTTARILKNIDGFTTAINIEVPEDVLDAAMKVRQYFDGQGIPTWRIMGMQKHSLHWLEIELLNKGD